MKKFIYILETGENNALFRSTYRIEANDLHEAINILYDDFGKEYGNVKQVIKNS